MSDSTLPSVPPAVAPRPQLLLARLNGALADRTLVPFWLFLIILLGAVFRFTGLKWDEGLHHHPDERFLMSVVNDVSWPTSIGAYFDEATSPLNPRNVGKSFWVYGDLPLTIVKGTGVLLDRLAPPSDGSSWQSYGRNQLVGRALNGLFDLGTILLLFFTARRLYKDHRVALLAALLYSMAVLPIQHAHFWVVDNMTTFFVTLTLFWLARVFDGEGSGRVADYALAGLFFGMALATKVSIATLALLFAAVGALKLYQSWRAEGRLSQPLAEGLILRLGLATLFGILAFRLFQPYAFSGLFSLAPRWLANLQEVQGQMTGEADPPWGYQWASRVRLLFPWKNMVLWGLGLPLGLAAWIGWATGAWQLVRRQRWAHLIPVLWIFVLFMHQGNQWVMSMRYLLPLYPMAALLAAWWLVWLAERGATRAGELRRGGLLSWTRRRAGVVAALVVAGTAIYALGFMNVYIRPFTHAQAVHWLAENAEPGSVIATEHYDEGLPAIHRESVLLGNFQLGVTYVDNDGNTRNDGQLLWYHGDNPEKLTTALGWLDETDYLVIVSNRIYGSVARLPERYPLTNNYYDALFDGRLGFERAVEITEGPTLFGLIELDDQYSRSGPGLFGLDWDTWLAAEEAFTVYDHPRVLIFRKTAEYDRERAEALLMEGVDWATISTLTAKQWTEQGGSAAPALRFDEETRADYEAAGTWSEIFDRDGFANRFPLVPWVLLLQLLTLLGLPFLWVVGAGLPERGYALAKPLGLLLVSFTVWLLASLKIVPFTVGGILVGAGLVGLAGGFVAWRSRMWGDKGALRRAWPALLRAELVFWLPFLLVLAIRWANPDLWHPDLGGEKPMDLSYLNAVVKSLYFPPLDPWFAGGYLNYYYFGFVMSAVLVKLTGVMPSISYNLLIPTFFALLAAGVWAVALALVSPRRPSPVARRRHAPVTFAALAVLMVCILGNLAELRILAGIFPLASQSTFTSDLPGVEALVKSIDGLVTIVREGQGLPGRNEWAYWTATRAITAAPGESGPINEMPWFTFLYADLHAHLMALPLTALVMGLGLGWLRAPRGRSRGAALLALALIALALGALWPANTWDVPTYALVLFGALGIREWWKAGRITLEGVLRTVVLWLAVMAAARLLYQPYHSAYAAAYTAVERWTGSRTPLGDYVQIHGFFLFLFAVALLSDLLFGRGHNAGVRMAKQSLRHLGRVGRLRQLRRLLVRPSAAPLLLPLAALIMAGGLLLVPLGYAVPGVNLMLAALALLLLARDRVQPLWQMALVLMLIGLGLATMVELIVLKGDIGRMNTVFKFYLQIWVLWGIAGAVAVARIARQLHRWSAEWRWLWRAGFATLLAISLLYPIFSTYAKVNDRFDRSVGPGLDGAAFMERATMRVGPDGTDPPPFELKWDAEAIRWMQDNIPGSPTIAEVSIPQLYRWGNRYAMWTGNPAIVGWDWHQRQQRAAAQPEQVSARVGDVLALYSTPDAAAAHATLTRYGARYLVVGPLERTYATPEGIAKFDAYRGVYWDLVYENPEVRIYRVLEGDEVMR